MAVRSNGPSGPFAFAKWLNSVRAGKTVTVHTGSGSNTARHRYRYQDWRGWNGHLGRLRLTP